MLFGVSFAGYGYFLVAQHRCWTSAVSHLLHLAMSVAMILMAWGLGTKPPTIWAMICFLLASAWFVRVAGQVSRASGDRLPNYYYAVMMAAMAWMYASMKGSLPGQSGHSTSHALTMPSVTDGSGMPTSAHDMSPPEPEPGWITAVNWIGTLGFAVVAIYWAYRLMTPTPNQPDAAHRPTQMRANADSSIHRRRHSTHVRRHDVSEIRQSSALTQHQRRMPAAPVHRTEPGVDTQPCRQYPDPDHFVGVDRIG
jgi:hypothetical protein